MTEYVVFHGPVAVGASTCFECACRIRSRYPIGSTDIVPSKVFAPLDTKEAANTASNIRVMQLPGADIVDNFIRDEYADASINDSERTKQILLKFYEYLAGQQS